MERKARDENQRRPDGLYQLNYKQYCAGFEIKDGKIVNAAPAVWAFLRRSPKTLFENSKRIGDAVGTDRPSESTEA